MAHKKITLLIIIFFLAYYERAHALAPAVHLQFNIGRRVVPIKGALIVEEELETTVREDATGILWKTTALYGLTNHIGLRLFIPVFLKRKLYDNVARGLSDISLEMLFLRFIHPYNVTLASVGFFAPTGSSKSTPQLGTHNVNLIFTAQWIHSSPHWYCSFLMRPIVAIERKDVYSGSILNFQYLFGPKFSLDDNTPLALLIEVDGAYRKAVTYKDIRVPNTGGTVIIAGPFISARVGRAIVQGRVQLPILQRYSGNQPNFKYLAAATVQYLF